MEWDTYNFSLSSVSHDLSGANPFLPLIVNPSSSYEMSFLVSPKNPSSLLITVKNQAGGAIDNAKATLSKTGFSQTLYTGRRNLLQTNWASSNYSSQSGNIDPESAPGQMTLLDIGGKYPTSTEWLISKTIDFGAADVAFYDVSSNPTSSPPQTGPQSLKFQIATNNDQSAWNFVGPDGTDVSYYTTSTILNPLHNNNRYLRYKIFMRTADENFTPTLNDLTINFSSPCITRGRAFSDGLNAGTYTLTIEKAGYQTFIDPAVAVGGGSQEYLATLTP